MFPLQRSEDLVFQILSTTDSSQQNKISQDLFFATNNCSFVPLDVTTTADHHHFTAAATAATTAAPISSRKRQQRESTCTEDVITATTTNNYTADDNKLKRIMHREIERQRRQEMATLYSSLRSLLPLEYVKGKRSTSDHMHEALNYIKQMQKNVQELERRRERLKMSSSTSIISSHNNLDKSGSSSSLSDQRTASAQNFVSVSRCRDGAVEVLVNCVAGGRSCFPLSRVLRTLLNERVGVVSCDSTKTDNRFLHRVQSEVICDEKRIDLEALQQKLSEVINF